MYNTFEMVWVSISRFALFIVRNYAILISHLRTAGEEH